MPRNVRSECVYCGCALTRRNMTIDHVIPVSRGGARDPRNEAPACRACNALKGPLTAAEFLAVRRDPYRLADARRRVMREITASQQAAAGA